MSDRILTWIWNVVFGVGTIVGFIYPEMRSQSYIGITALIGFWLGRATIEQDDDQQSD